MKKLSALITILLLSQLGVAAQNTEWIDPADVFVIEDDPERQCNALVAGSWEYKSPAVEANGSTVIGKLGKPIAKSKLKKKVSQTFKKLKINKRLSRLAFDEYGAFYIGIAGKRIKGTYDYDCENEIMNLKVLGLPMKTHVSRDGKKLKLFFRSDKLLTLISVVGGFSHSDTMKALSFLLNNYDNVMIGFEFKRK